jgi:tRNA(Arg) A34 adenosine deaminase TadA
MSNPHEEALVQQAHEYLASRLVLIEPHTAEEYFTVLLDRAVRAIEAGNYGISAALAVCYDDVELISFGQSTMISECDPFGHAEANAIRSLQRFIALDVSGRIECAVQWINSESVVTSQTGDRIFVRSAPPSYGSKSILYTTLEPCPMCTVAIVNSRIQRVIIAIPDEPGGALESKRLAKLPALWPRIAASQGLQVDFANSQFSQDADTYIPPELSAMLSNVFWNTKPARDAEVSKGVLFKSDMGASTKDVLKGIRRVN